MNLFDLKGKVAVVTGASSGLGADAARAYAEAGADVALLARRKDRLESLAKELESKGVRALAVQCDVSDEHSAKAAVDEVLAAFGKIDILLNNAGIGRGPDIINMPVKDWDECFAINNRGMFLMCRFVLPGMLERKYGKIVNIGSINARIADKPDEEAKHVYSASKGAVEGFTVGLTSTYAKHGVTVNTVCPGLFHSEMTDAFTFADGIRVQRYEEKCPMSRVGKTGELNGAIIFLSSDASSYVSGQHIYVDGGLSAV